MSPKDCEYYESCGAPLCPFLDRENSTVPWFPDEEICKRKKGLPKWVAQQKKIAAKCDPENYWYYFNIEMLMINFRVTSKVKGLDPDIINEGPQLKRWHKQNKGIKRRKISGELRDKKRESIAIARKSKKHLELKPSLECVPAGEIIMGTYQQMTFDDIILNNKLGLISQEPIGGAASYDGVN